MISSKEEELKEVKDQLGSLNKAAYKVKSKLLELNAIINGSKQNIKNYSQKIKQCDSELESLEIQKSGTKNNDGKILTEKWLIAIRWETGNKTSRTPVRRNDEKRNHWNLD